MLPIPHDGPAFYKFGRYVRYAVSDFDAWAESCRRSTAASPVAPRILMVNHE
jgi:hypothetical protein